MKVYEAPEGSWLLDEREGSVLRVLPLSLYKAPGWVRRYNATSEGYAVDSGEDTQYMNLDLEVVDVDPTDRLTVGASGPACYPFTRRGTDGEFPFVKGDKIEWRDGYLLVTAVGEYYFLATDFVSHRSHHEDRYAKHDFLEALRYEEPAVYPERWFAVFAARVDTARLAEYAARDDLRAARNASCTPFGILHLLPDGSTEMIDP